MTSASSPPDSTAGYATGMADGELSMIFSDRVLGFALTSLVIIVVPGPGVLFVVGVPSRMAAGWACHGLRSRGRQLRGRAPVALGLGVLVERSAQVFTVVKLAGALYLVWLGIRAIRKRNALGEALGGTAAPGGDRRAAWQGFMVGVTNPKAFILFGALLPQFVSRPAGHVPAQMLMLALVSVAIGLASDSVWGFTASAARAWFARSPRRLALVGGAGGLAMIGVGPARLGRGFRWLLASSWITYLGDGITLAAGPLLVASQTHNPLAVAMAAFLQRLPWLMFGLYAGVVADRVSRRGIVITAGLVRATILILLTGSIISHRVDTAVVLAALFLFGVNETFADTATTTLPPMLVDKRDLGIANSRTLAGMIAGSQLAGPPIGAALFAAGMALPFISETVCVLAGVLLITRIRLPARSARAEATRVRDEIRQGWRWLWAHPAVRTLAITIFTFNITFGAAWSVLVLYARQRLSMGAVGFGLIMTAMAVGGLVGTASYGWLERHVPLGLIMRGGLIIETLTHLALALTRWMWLALIIFTIFGAHAFIWGTTSTSVRQRAVPAEFQGRVSSVYLTGMVGGIVIGSALGGAAASAWGITAPFWFGFAGSAIILAFIWRSLLQIAHADEDLRADAPADWTPPRQISQTAQQAAQAGG